jgi:L-amino acid N-acyltransferase YncA
MIRPVELSDAQAIANIYNPFITDTVITFEYEPVTPEEIASRIKKVLDLGLPYLVAEEEDKVVGYAYASQWRTRAAYRYTVESTVYLDPAYKGKGLGTALYRALLEELKVRGIHVVLGGITIPNPASVALHEKMGFVKAAEHREVGFKFDHWLDVGFWELKL